MGEDARINQAANVEVCIGETVKTQQRANAILGIRGQDDGLALVGALHCPIRDIQVEIQEQTVSGFADHPARPVKHDCFGQRTCAELLVQDCVEEFRIECQGNALPVQVLRHGAHVGTDRLAVLVQIGLRNGK